MRIKVDEDLPRAVAERLRTKGHEASTVLEQEMGGWKDEALWVAVQEKKQLLVTADKGFGDIRRTLLGPITAWSCSALTKMESARSSSWWTAFSRTDRSRASEERSRS